MSKVNYRKLWEEENKCKIPDDYEIHHIDGNHENNQIENLKLVSILEHLEIHKKQKDWGAVKSILMRLEHTKDEMIEASSKLQISLLSEGKHNFQKMSKSKRSEISRETLKKRIEKFNVSFLNIDKEQEIFNAKKGGDKAAKNKLGFLNPEKDNHGSKFVKETFWWTRSDGKRKRSKECPGDDWKKGMKNEC